MKQHQLRAIHTAVGAVWGKASRCELCNGKNQSKRFEWSNKDHKYQLNRDDWWELCATCHRRWDRQKFGHRTWNKGKIGLQPWMNTIGLNHGTPWNKGLKYTREQRSKLRKSRLENKLLTLKAL